MSEAGQIRINELARELEIKAKVLIDYLPDAGITEKKTHSSSLEHDQAERVRKHFRDLAASEAAAEAEKTAKAAAAKAKPAARPAAPSAAVAPSAARPA
ncbi:MAG: translation initiation factor IF-2 N-terminal domain-containing protein, partial [Candidatus Acidiferrales bacterium]